MPILKKLIKINESKAVVIPYSYFKFYRSMGKEINEVSLEIDKKIILEPILVDIKTEEKNCNYNDIKNKIDTIVKGRNP